MSRSSKDFAPQAKPPSLKSFLSLLEGGVTWSGLSEGGGRGRTSRRGSCQQEGRTCPLRVAGPGLPREVTRPAVCPLRALPPGAPARCVPGPPCGAGAVSFWEKGQRPVWTRTWRCPNAPGVGGQEMGGGRACGARALPVPFPWAVCPCSGPLVGVWVQGHQCRADVKTAQSITQRPRSAWFRGAGGAFISIAMPFQ